MRKIILLLSVVALTLLAACSSNEDGVSGLTVSTKELNVKSQGHLVYFDIMANDVNWRVTAPKAEWIEFIPTTPIGSSDQTITVKIGENPTSNPRTGEIVIISSGNVAAKITVNQKGRGVITNPTSITFTKEGGVQSLTVSADGSWTTTQSDGASWYSVTPTSGSGNATIQITASAYAEVLPRSNDLVFNAGSDNESRVQVTQRGIKDTYSDNEVVLYKDNTKGTKPVHLVIMGDGYIESDYAVIGGSFIKMVDEMVDAFFAVEPYNSYKDYFRVSFVVGYSQEQGGTIKNKFPASMGGLGPFKRNTLFSSVLEGGQSTGINCDDIKVFNYAKFVPGVNEEVLDQTTVMLGINLPVYAGTCKMYLSGRSVSQCPTGSTFTKIVQHEGGGHGFGRLLDEYRYYEEEMPTEEKRKITGWRDSDMNILNPYYGNNVDFTGDLDKVHWKHFFSMDKYKNTVNLFEGSCLYSFGVWRAEFNSCMNDNIPYFNAPSREAIVRRIMNAAGETFSFDAFYAADVHNPPARTRAIDPNFIPLGKPILVNE